MTRLWGLSEWLSRKQRAKSLTQSADAKEGCVDIPQLAPTPDQQSQCQYTIGTLADAIGIQGKAVVYYERIGLLPKPPRTSGNYRAYTTRDVARIKFIRRARDLGFSLEQVRILLQLADGEGNDPNALSASARDQLADVNQRITHLNALRRGLNDLIAKCDQGEVLDTQIIKALSSRPR